MLHRWFVVNVLRLAAASIALTALGPSPSFADDLPRDWFQQLLSRIRAGIADSAWKKSGWRDAGIESTFDALEEEIWRVAPGRAFTLPVRLSNVHAEAEPRTHAGAFLKDGLILSSGDVKVSHCERSMILSDGSATVSHANQCVIVARGAVAVAHSTASLVLAGQFVAISHDGDDPRLPRGSVVISGSVADLSCAENGTVVSAPDLVSIFGQGDVTLVNSPVRVLNGFRTKMGFGQVDVVDEPDWKLRIAVAPNALAGHVRLLEVTDEPIRTVVVADRRGGQVELVPGGPIDDAGLPELAGWSLTLVESGIVLFSRGDSDAAFVWRSAASGGYAAEQMVASLGAPRDHLRFAIPRPRPE